MEPQVVYIDSGVLWPQRVYVLASVYTDDNKSEVNNILLASQLGYIELRPQKVT